LPPDWRRGEGLADADLVEAGYGDDVAGDRFLDLDLLEPS